MGRRERLVPPFCLQLRGGGKASSKGGGRQWVTEGTPRQCHMRTAGLQHSGLARKGNTSPPAQHWGLSPALCIWNVELRAGDCARNRSGTTIELGVHAGTCLSDISLCYSSAVTENSILKKSTFSNSVSREEHSCHYLQKMKNQIVNVVRTKLHEWRIAEYQLSVKNSAHER